MRLCKQLHPLFYFTNLKWLLSRKALNTDVCQNNRYEFLNGTTFFLNNHILIILLSYWTI